jgi:hypothetical protein
MASWTFHNKSVWELLKAVLWTDWITTLLPCSRTSLHWQPWSRHRYPFLQLLPAAPDTLLLYLSELLSWATHGFTDLTGVSSVSKRTVEIVHGLTVRIISEHVSEVPCLPYGKCAIHDSNSFFWDHKDKLWTKYFSQPSAHSRPRGRVLKCCPVTAGHCVLGAVSSASLSLCSSGYEAGFRGLSWCHRI